MDDVHHLIIASNHNNVAFQCTMVSLKCEHKARLKLMKTRLFTHKSIVCCIVEGIK